MINIFLFDLSEAVAGLVQSYLYGLLFGFVMGGIRFLIFYYVERREA